jgi:hypothetical protein
MPESGREGGGNPASDPTIFWPARRCEMDGSHMTSASTSPAFDNVEVIFAYIFVIDRLGDRRDARPTGEATMSGGGSGKICTHLEDAGKRLS